MRPRVLLCVLSILALYCSLPDIVQGTRWGWGVKRLASTELSRSIHESCCPSQIYNNTSNVFTLESGRLMSLWETAGYKQVITHRRCLPDGGQRNSQLCRHPGYCHQERQNVSVLIYDVYSGPRMEHIEILTGCEFSTN